MLIELYNRLKIRKEYMAYYENLDNQKQEEINEQLLIKVRAEHESAYQSNLAKAKSKLAKKRCAGRYEGAWWRLMNAWRDNKVTNLHVYDCLAGDRVIGDDQGVSFTSCY
jgi:hypothetical protein